MLRKKLFGETSEPNSDLKRLKTSHSEQVDNENVPEISSKLIEIQLKLNTKLKEFDFIKGSINYVYNPLEYAFEPNKTYVCKYCTGSKKLLFVGMNPGPFGMCQTGVPFGDVACVRDWLKIEGPVSKPQSECPERPIQGFECTKKEQSGTRFWNFLADLCGTPEIFFQNAFVYNYCPLAFMGKKNGVNITPPSINLQDRKQLEGACDESYLEVIELLQPEIIIAVGEYSERRTNKILKARNIPNHPKVLRLSHPSPKSLNNHNWPEKAAKFFADNDLIRFFPSNCKDD